MSYARLAFAALGVVTLVACGSSPESFFSASGVVEIPAAGTTGEAGEAGDSARAGSPSAGAAGSSAGSSSGGSAGSAGAQGGAQPIAGGGAGGGTGGTAPMGGSAGALTAGGGGLTGGAGAPPVVVPGVACKNKVVPAFANVGDFEQGVEGWGAYVNKDFGVVTSTAPGASLSQLAATFAGGFAEQSGMYHQMPCTDVSAFDGISFWAKGRGGDHVRFLAAIPGTQPITDGGDCDVNTKTCWDHPGKLFILTNQWQRYSASWKELDQLGWGSPASFGNVVSSVNWINDGTVASFEFSIDQVRLYKGSPE